MTDIKSHEIAINALDTAIRKLKESIELSDQLTDDEICPWESGELGRDEEFVKRVPEYKCPGAYSATLGAVPKNTTHVEKDIPHDGEWIVL